MTDNLSDLIGSLMVTVKDKMDNMEFDAKEPSSESMGNLFGAIFGDKEFINNLTKKIEGSDIDLDKLYRPLDNKSASDMIENEKVETIEESTDIIVEDKEEPKDIEDREDIKSSIDGDQLEVTI